MSKCIFAFDASRSLTHSPITWKSNLKRLKHLYRCQTKCFCSVCFTLNAIRFKSRESMIFRIWIDRKCHKNHFVFNHYAILFLTMCGCHIFRFNLLDAYLTTRCNQLNVTSSLCIKIKMKLFRFYHHPNTEYIQFLYFFYFSYKKRIQCDDFVSHIKMIQMSLLLFNITI